MKFLLNIILREGHKHRFSSLSSQHFSYKVIRLPYGTFKKFVLLYINFHKAIYSLL